MASPVTAWQAVLDEVGEEMEAERAAQAQFVGSITKVRPRCSAALPGPRRFKTGSFVSTSRPAWRGV